MYLQSYFTVSGGRNMINRSDGICSQSRPALPSFSLLSQSAQGLGGQHDNTCRLVGSARRVGVCARAGGHQANISVRKNQAPVAQQELPTSSSFLDKVKAAWLIFFPPKPEKVSAREAGKSRLRMILVADRCGLNQASMHEMRHSIVRAVSDYVEIEAEDMVDVNVSSDPEMGTVYSVAVPVRRVKAQARSGSLIDGEMETDGVTMMWDDDPEDRFPFGC